MKRNCRYLLMISLLLFCIPFADAQGSASIAVGVGTNHNTETGLGIDNLDSFNALGSCIPGPGDPFCQSTPGLNGFFLGFSGDAMVSSRFGVGGEISFLPSKGNYGPLQFRQLFYDFNGIFSPINRDRVALKLMGGIGGARTSFSFNQNSCIGTAICSNTNISLGSSSHFQLHAAAGVEIYLTDHLFVRPQFDLRYIPNFTDQFGRNVVPGGMIWLGFGTGSH